MKRLGISIYPEHSTPEEDNAYIAKVAQLGFKRIFTCLLSVNDPEQEKQRFKTMIEHANSLGMEVILDVAPNVFKQLNISYDDLSFFAAVGAAGIRLDEGFDGAKEAMMTFNEFGLKIEINASADTRYLDNILSNSADKDKLIACHNFYPQQYTGLSLSHFTKCNEMIKPHNLPIAAFVSSNNKKAYGPWPVQEGLCTLEAHRFLPIDIQARHLFYSGIDDVIIANAYATDDELEALSRIHPTRLMYKINLNDAVSDIEKEIIFDYNHYVRGDMSEYMARSTFPRIDYKDASIPPHNTKDLQVGDVVILNNNYSRYKGELHIVTKAMPNDGRKNIVGSIPENELFLLEFIKPWAKFGFIKES